MKEEEIAKTGTEAETTAQQEQGIPLYEDETQAAVEALRKEAKDAARYEDDVDAGDVIRSILGFVFTVVLAFGWMMLMLLIISFVGLGYLHLEIKIMFLVSVIFALLAGVFYVRGKIRRERIRRIRKKGKKEEK